MTASAQGPVADWHVRGSYFEACNCEAICPCRSVGGRPGGPSSFGECFGALSWHIHHGHADGLDLSGLHAVLSIRYLDRVQPVTPWQVVLYVDQGAADSQRAAIADIFLGRPAARSHGSTAQQSAKSTPCARPGSPSSTPRPVSASAWSAT